jgi:DNA-binding transcriptional LysR family regulator
VADPGIDLRLMRSFVAVAQRGSFSRAAEDVHVAQQAVSQHIAALERALGTRLIDRTRRGAQLTPAGVVFLAESRRVLAAAERAVRRARAAARGASGTLRVVYTLTAAFDTVPALLARAEGALPELAIESREVFGGDIPQLLDAEAADLAIAPATAYPRGLAKRTLRREPMLLAVSDDDPMATAGGAVELGTLAGRTFETWPREMAPGFYDAVLAACRAAGFEPRLDEHGTGNAVWRYIVEQRGIGLVDGSAAGHLPAGLQLVPLADPPTILAVEAVWRADGATPLLERLLETATALGDERGWNG